MQSASNVIYGTYYTAVLSIEELTINRLCQNMAFIVPPASFFYALDQLKSLAAGAPSARTPLSKLTIALSDGGSSLVRRVKNPKGQKSEIVKM